MFYLGKTTIFHEIHIFKNQRFIKKCFNKSTQTEELKHSHEYDFGMQNWSEIIIKIHENPPKKRVQKSNQN